MFKNCQRLHFWINRCKNFRKNSQNVSNDIVYIKIASFVEPSHENFKWF